MGICMKVIGAILVVIGAFAIHWGLGIVAVGIYLSVLAEYYFKQS